MFIIIIMILFSFFPEGLYGQKTDETLSIGVHSTVWTNGDTPGYLLKTNYQRYINNNYEIQLGIGFSRSSKLRNLINRKLGELPCIFYIREHVLWEGGFFRTISLNDLDSSIFIISLTGFILSLNEMQNIGFAVNKETDEIIIVNDSYSKNVMGFGILLDYKINFYKTTKIGPIFGLRYFLNEYNDMVWSLGLKIDLKL